MRNALHVLAIAAACLIFPIAASGGNYYYPPTAYSYNPAPVPQLFYAPPIVRTMQVGYGGYGYGGYGYSGHGGCCAPPPPPVPCCQPVRSTCCGPSAYGYGYGGHGYGGHAQAAPYFHGSAGFQGHYHHHYRPPHHSTPHHPRPPRHSQSMPKATPQPAQLAPQNGYAPQPAQAVYAQPYAVASPYYAHPQYVQPQAPARIAAAPRSKPTSLRGVAKALPPVKDEASATSKAPTATAAAE